MVSTARRGSMLPLGQMPRSGSTTNTLAAVKAMPPNTKAGTHGARRPGATRNSHAISTAQSALQIAFAMNSGSPSGKKGAVEKPVGSIRPAACSSARVDS